MVIPRDHDADMRHIPTHTKILLKNSDALSVSTLGCLGWFRSFVLGLLLLRRWRYRLQCLNWFRSLSSLAPPALVHCMVSSLWETVCYSSDRQGVSRACR